MNAITIPMEIVSAAAVGAVLAGLVLIFMQQRRVQQTVKDWLEKSHQEKLKVVAGLEQHLHRLQEQLAEFQASQQESSAEARRALGHFGLTLQELSNAARPAKEKTVVKEKPGSGGAALDKKCHVFSLAQKGVSPADISRRLKLYHGETELVLGLKKFMAEKETEASQPPAKSAGSGRQELPEELAELLDI